MKTIEKLLKNHDLSPSINQLIIEQFEKSVNNASQKEYAKLEQAFLSEKLIFTTHVLANLKSLGRLQDMNLDIDSVNEQVSQPPAFTFKL